MTRSDLAVANRLCLFQNLPAEVFLCFRVLADEHEDEFFEAEALLLAVECLVVLIGDIHCLGGGERCHLYPNRTSTILIFKFLKKSFNFRNTDHLHYQLEPAYSHLQIRENTLGEILWRP